MNSPDPVLRVDRTTAPVSAGGASRSSPHHEQPLVVLMAEVERARAHVAAGRSRATGPASREDQEHRGQLLLAALDAYAAGALALGAPLPYRYRDEMRLLRAVL